MDIKSIVVMNNKKVLGNIPLVFIDNGVAYCNTYMNRNNIEFCMRRKKGVVVRDEKGKLHYYTSEDMKNRIEKFLQ